MQKTDPSYFLDLLEVFRLGLLTGVITKQPIIAWADDLIMQEGVPDYFLIELSLSGHSNLNDVAGLLDEYVGEHKPEISKQAFLGILFHLRQANQLTFAQVVQAIDWLTLHIDYTTEEHSFMAGIDDDYRLASEKISGTLVEVERFVLRFLSIYQSFRFDNRSEWQSFNEKVLTQVNALYQQLKTW